MKAILMSIKPKWCELIFSGDKTIEVRKTAPKLKPPFKVYVYETLGKHKSCRKCGKTNCPFVWCYEGAGAVVGEFVCDKVEENIPYYSPMFEEFIYPCFECGNDCLSLEETQKYGKGDTLYGLHITAPKLYDTPKELSEFRKPDVWYTTETDNTSVLVHETGWTITRPPQSFMYVEEIEE